MDIPPYLDLGSKKYTWEEVKDHKWAKGAYMELADQAKILSCMLGNEELKVTPDYLKQIGVVEYLMKKLNGYLTLKKVDIT